MLNDKRSEDMKERICFPYEENINDIPRLIKNIEQLYEKMTDEISKKIFVNRFLLSITRNYLYMKEVILCTEGGRRLDEVIHSKKDSPQYIYGAGIRGRRLVELFPDIEWKGFIDKNRSKEDYCDIKIISLDYFAKVYTRGTTIFVSNMFETKDIVEDLLEKGIAFADIYLLNDFDQEGMKDMYFPSECIGEFVRKDRAFIDVGCYDGKDSLDYMKWIGDNKVSVYAFEPDIYNYKICLEKLHTYTNVKLFNIGLSDKEEDIYMISEGERSHFGNKDGLMVHTDLLDNIIKDDAVGFIKMDVEGHEINVLRGAERIIKEQHPILAVSLYHKRSDIWRIPIYLLSLNSSYYFYMRYYGAANGDTVLYAVSCD